MGGAEKLMVAVEVAELVQRSEVPSGSSASGDLATIAAYVTLTPVHLHLGSLLTHPVICIF